MCDEILIVSPGGRIALIDKDGGVEYSEQSVPMNLAGLLAHPDIEDFRPDRFRVADILLKQRSEGVWELFATHHYFTGECTLFRLSAATVERDEASYSVSPSWRTLFDADPCLHPARHAGHQAGGRILTDGPDHLLVVVGDHGWVWTGNALAAQDTESHLGKLVRVDIETGEAEILALGLRNPQGFTRDADGNLWETEHGPQGGDELNLLEAGANYGSPSVTYGVQYGRTINVEDKHKLGGHVGYARPALAWVPSIAVSELIVNDERWFPLWKDDLLIGSLGDNQNGRSLFRVRRDGTTIQYVERILLGYRVRDLAPMLDGRIALLADGGSVYFLSRSYRRCDEESIRQRDAHSVDCEALSALLEANQSGASADAETFSGAELYAANCASCHNLSVEEHGVGPHLVGLIGRQAGEVKGYNASDALRKFGGVWTPESLAEFLADPQAFAPGAAMSSQGLSADEAQAVADYVAGLPGE